MKKFVILLCLPVRGVVDVSFDDTRDTNVDVLVGEDEDVGDKLGVDREVLCLTEVVLLLKAAIERDGLNGVVFDIDIEISFE